MLIYTQTRDTLGFLTEHLLLNPSDTTSLSLLMSPELTQAIVERAGHDWHALLAAKPPKGHFSAMPRFALSASAIAPHVETLGMIYGAEPSDLRRHYYAEITPRGLWLKYQSILGSRCVGILDETSIEAFIGFAAQLLSPVDDTLAPSAIDPVVGELRQLQVDDGALLLPTTHLRHYAEIKRRLIHAGGKFKSPNRFVFPTGVDAGNTLARLIAGESIRLQQETQFFETLPALAVEVAAAAGPLGGKRVLEPSAGRGALASLARAAGANVVTVENWGVNAQVLRDKGHNVYEEDFLTLDPETLGLFDVILANPPFTADADATHVMHMLRFLKPGGVLSTIVSRRWTFAANGKAKAFREWIEANDVSTRDIPAGAFAASGTDIATTLLVYRKPNDVALAA